MQRAAPAVSFDVALSSYRQWIGCSAAPLVAPRRGPGRPAKRRKVIVASDFYCPCHSVPALNALLREAPDTDLLVLDGDLADMWSTSRFTKTRRLTDPCSEMRDAQVVLTLLAERFKEIRVIGRNHDQRPRKFLADRLPPDILDYIAETGPLVFEPLKFLAAGLKNVHVVEPIKAGFGEFSFFHQIGDAVICHAEKYTQIPNRAVSGPVLHWFKSYAEPQGLVNPFTCLVAGHTHQAGSVWGDYGVLAIENGVMCEPIQSYQADPRIISQRPSRNGWTILYQEHGVMDLSASRFVPFS